MANVCTCSHHRVLAEVGEELKSKAPMMTKQKKESEFLKQKASYYQKLVTSLKVHKIQ